MSEKRSEDQVITQAPILATFGGKEYKIRLLPYAESQEWRGKFAKVLGHLPLFTSATATPKQFAEVINGMFVDTPDEIVDLIFEYAKDLPKDEIKAVAYDVELGKAFEDIAKVAFFLTRSMMAIPAKLSQ